MNESKLKTPEQLRAFLQGTLEVEFSPTVGQDRAQRYAHIQGLVRRFGYAGLPRADKAVVLRYLERTTGYSRQQLTRLVGRALAGKALVTHYGPPRKGFTRIYTEHDVWALAEIDAARTARSRGRRPSTSCNAQPGCTGSYAINAWRGFRWRICTICAATGATSRAASTGARPARITWPSRYARHPSPKAVRATSASTACYPRRSGRGQGALPHQRRGLRHPMADRGHLREDQRGLPPAHAGGHARAVPLRGAGHPCRQWLGIHQSHGGQAAGEAAHRVLPKSRPRHEPTTTPWWRPRTVAVVRKHLGYAHIAQRFAEQVNEFVAKFLNPYVNFHRPCLFPECHTNAKGKITKRYPQRLVSTPLEKLASLRPEQQNLKPGITLQSLQGQAAQHTDNQAAQQLNQARTQLFASINPRLKKAA